MYCQSNLNNYNNIKVDWTGDERQGVGVEISRKKYREEEKKHVWSNM